MLFTELSATTAEVAASAVDHSTAESLDSHEDKITLFRPNCLEINNESRYISVAHHLKTTEPIEEKSIIVQFISYC